jgi:hypothetical protein
VRPSWQSRQPHVRRDISRPVRWPYQACPPLGVSSVACKSAYGRGASLQHSTLPTMTTRPVLFIQWTSRESTHITTSDSARKPIGICCHLLLTVHLFNVHGRPLDEATQQSYSCWFAGSNNWVAGENSAHTVAFLEGADGCPAIEQNRSRRSD